MAMHFVSVCNVRAAEKSLHTVNGIINGVFRFFLFLFFASMRNGFVLVGRMDERARERVQNNNTITT